jgi:hypothetical protein
MRERLSAVAGVRRGVFFVIDLSSKEARKNHDDLTEKQQRGKKNRSAQFRADKDGAAAAVFGRSAAGV